MKSQDRIKRTLHLLKSDGTELDIGNIPLRIELRRGIDIVKIFTNDVWNSTQGTPDGAVDLLVVADNIHFLLIVDGDELDGYIAGIYTIHAYYFEEDTNFSDGSCRRYAPFDDEIIINE
jgi:hypothetical protein